MSSEDTCERTTRRRVLAASGSAALVGLAGCLGGGDDQGDELDTDDSTQDDDHDDDHGHDDDGHMAIAEFDILDRDHDEEVAAYVHGDHWHDGPLEVPAGDRISVGAYIEDEDGHEVELDGEFELRAEIAEGEPEVVDFDFHGDHVHIHGEEEGITDIVFHIWHDDHADYTTPPITVVVGEDDHDHDDHESVSEFEIVDRSEDEVTAYVDGDHWHGDLPAVPIDDNISLGANIEDEEGHEIELDGDHYELRVDLADDADDIVTFDHHGDHVHIIGDESGTTQVVFMLYHDDHSEYETPAIDVTVDE